jgi:hypothetical protein
VCKYVDAACLRAYVVYMYASMPHTRMYIRIVSAASLVGRQGILVECAQVLYTCLPHMHYPRSVRTSKPPRNSISAHIQRFLQTYMRNTQANNSVPRARRSPRVPRASGQRPRCRRGAHQKPTSFEL